MNIWKEITEAPKDGSHILAAVSYVADNQFACKYVRCHWKNTGKVSPFGEEEGLWVLDDNVTQVYPVVYFPVEPTVWADVS
jgi:hypothetical protein